MVSMCTTSVKEDGEIVSVSSSASVMSGNIFNIEVTVKDRGNLWGNTLKLNLIDEDTGNVIATSSNEQSNYEAGGSKIIKFTGRMPNKDYHLNLSLIDVNTLYYDDCQDFRSITIKLARSPSEEQIEPLKEETISKYLPVFLIGGFILLLFVMYILLRR